MTKFEKALKEKLEMHGCYLKITTERQTKKIYSTTQRRLRTASYLVTSYEILDSIETTIYQSMDIEDIHRYYLRHFASMSERRDVLGSLLR